MFPFQLEFWQQLHYDNIFLLAVELLLGGGWFFIFLALWVHLRDNWLDWRQNLFAAINPHALMEVRIPEDNDRDIEAIEHLFSQIHAIHRGETWWEHWWKGMYNLKVSVEIVSFEGHITYYIRSTHKHKHLVQAAIYAQYPKAQVRELKDEEDFVHIFPDKMPDQEFEMLGTEYVLYKPNFFPIKTYKEHKTPDGKYIDPLRHLMEVMSSLKEGEYMWYQIVMVPDREGWGLQFKHEADKLHGIIGGVPRKKPASILSILLKEIWSFIKIILALIKNFIWEVYRQLFVGTGKIIGKQITEHTYKEVGRQLKGMGKEAVSQIACLHEAFLSQFRKKKPRRMPDEEYQFIINNYVRSYPELEVEVNVPGTKFPSDYVFLSEKRKKIIDSVERKLSKQIFKSCVRVLYFAKKPVYAKFRFWVEAHGFFKHFNDIDYNVWIRGEWSMTSADYFFARLRKKLRQNTLIKNAKSRDWYAGDRWVYLTTEELASMWHFPLREDLLADVKTVTEPVIAPRSVYRGRAGYNKGRLLDIDAGVVPEDLPVTEFEPYNYS